MSGQGRTFWWAKDSGWWRRELIVELGQEFGAAGPAVIDWLSCEAKLQNDGGRVKSGRTAVAHGAFVDAVTVGHVLSRAVELGVLDDFEEDGRRFTCRISGWRADQDRGRAAARKADQRERDSSATTGDPAQRVPVTDGDESRHVTARHGEAPTEQDRTEELPPIPPKGGRARDRSFYEEALGRWCERYFPGVEVAWVRTVLLRTPDPKTPQRVRAVAATNPMWAEWLGVPEQASEGAAAA